jgi:hypothetical protein
VTSLDGRHHQLPDDRRAQHTFIFAALRRERQALVDDSLMSLAPAECFGGRAGTDRNVAWRGARS